MPQVSYDRRAVIVDGRRRLLLSGAIHYPRSTPAMWPDLMKRSRDAGLNTVETYVFWNLHEHQRGLLDFSGRLDLALFCRLAKEQGLHVILRIGPYICAETNYGGFPPWLRDVPGIAMRTYNEPFLREKDRWVRLLCEYLQPMFAPSGGPIILAQLENEYRNVAAQYGAEGQRYLEWVVKLGQSLDLGIPWIMCSGSAPGAIETINEANPHRALERHWNDHPDQPALCTELYPAWYDTWIKPHHVRAPQSLAYAVARFVAAGGSGINYYMWHGGTNFGRESMYLQTTSYDFDAPLDEFGLPTTKSQHLARLHHVLAENEAMLLAAGPNAPLTLGPKQLAYVYADGQGELAFLCNDDPDAPGTVTFTGQAYELPPQSVTLVGGGKVLLNTAKVEESCVIRRAMKPIKGALAPFRKWDEPTISTWPDALRCEIVADSPVEQLALTHDETDYCWYTVRLAVSKAEAGEGTLTLDRAADMAHVFIDGRLRAPAPAPRKEDRGPTDSDAYKQEFRLKLSPGRHQLSLLACAIGMIKGDWMLGKRNMVEEKKGLWGPVRWNGKEIKGPWQMQPGLVAERLGLPGEPGLAARWKRVARGASRRPLTWYRTTFTRPKGGAPLVLDMSGMTKGLAWVNGKCIGRYWLLPAGDEPEGWLAHLVDPQGPGQPTQRHYHVPLDWLRDRNTLVIFEELGGDPNQIRLCRRV